MKITFYNNSSNENIINKELEELNTINFKFKNNSNILRPNLLLKNYTKGNYCYIHELKRYYYVDTIDLINGDLYNVKCSVDVLMSYKDDILNSKYYSIDGTLTTINNELDFNEIYDSSKFLLILGG